MQLRNYILLAFMALATFFILPVNATFAQATRTWVSGVGDDANPCSRTAPCKTFAGAISKTAAAGEINCLDPGGFGVVTITKSITIACEGVIAGVLNAGSQITVNATATDVVVLRGLDIDSTLTGPGINGIRLIAGGSLIIERCVIRDNTSVSPNGNGVLFAPSSGISELYIVDSYISGNVAGVLVKPTGTGGAKVSVINSTFENNGAGLRLDGSTGSGAIDASVNDSTFSGNSAAGIVVFNGGTAPAINVSVIRTSTVNNGASGGLRVDGANSTIRIGSSLIFGNGTGTAVLNGGVIQSYGDNQIDGNAVNGPNPPTIALK